MFKIQKCVTIFLVFFSLLALVANPAQAAPLYLLGNPAADAYPEITTFGALVSYDPGDPGEDEGIFRITDDGFFLTQTIEVTGALPSPDYNIASPTYDITLVIDKLTGAPSSGSLTVGGSPVPWPESGNPPLGAGPTLLTGEIDKFGFASPGGAGSDIFEFVFQVSGGDLWSSGTWTDSLASVIIDAGTSNTMFDGTWDTAFNNGTGFASNVSTFSIAWDARNTMPGDVQVDFDVDIQDASIMISNWQKTVPGWEGGDMNGDGKVLINDMAALNANWGWEGDPGGLVGGDLMVEAPQIPEPGTLVLASLGLVAVAFWGRGRKR